MEPPRQSIPPPAIDPQPRPADREIYHKPASTTHRERPQAASGGCPPS
ncbi:MAG: hypothetical protein VB099_09295 [Candidatus Limiplasma sp.]|nr:hypothetical protein [Candidatus Limiplasma sp.]